MINTLQQIHIPGILAGRSEGYVGICCNKIGFFGFVGFMSPMKSQYVKNDATGCRINFHTSGFSIGNFHLFFEIFGFLGLGVLNILGFGVLNRNWGPRHFQDLGSSTEIGVLDILGLGVLNRTWGPQHFRTRGPQQDLASVFSKASGGFFSPKK